ncbi:MAG: hypothetical protein RLY31_2526 [Bacteroidota bacterium]
MKTVLLVRHAKSSWDHPFLDDLERPLNARGLQDAPLMAKVLKTMELMPQAILCSPSVRTLSTAAFFKEHLGVAGEDFHVLDRLYEAGADVYGSVISGLENRYACVMIVGHNPELTAVANRFLPLPISNLPTCGVVQVTAEAAAWPDFNTSASFRSMLFLPKQFR